MREEREFRKVFDISRTTFKMTIFLSDLHLAAKKSKAEHISKFLSQYKKHDLVLVGDIIDIWRFRQAFSFSKKTSNIHVDCIRKILKHKSVKYVWGNHDEFLERFEGSFGNIETMERYEYTCSLGKRYLVIHGHQFDLMNRHPWLCKLGDRGYDLCIFLNEHMNRIRRLFGLKYWSISKYVKVRFKRASMMLENYEKTLSFYAKANEYDGIICGHIHDPKDTYISGIHYLNCGCWTDEENLTYLIDEGNGIVLRRFSFEN